MDAQRNFAKQRLVWMLGCGLAVTLAAAAGDTRAADDKPVVKEAAPAKEEFGFELSETERALLKSTNQERAKVDLPPLKPNKQLFEAARGHSANMAKQGRMSHVLDGRGPGERIAEVGYLSSTWGENCAAGQTSAQEVVGDWMNSPGHRGNLLSREYLEIGLGLAPDGNGGYYWTQVFAVPRP